MKIKERNPKMTNVYPEIGSLLGVCDSASVMCQHLMGPKTSNLRADHVIGERLPLVGFAAMGDRRIQALPDHDELCDKFGYTKYQRDKAKNLCAETPPRLCVDEALSAKRCRLMLWRSSSTSYNDPGRPGRKRRTVVRPESDFAEQRSSGTGRAKLNFSPLWQGGAGGPSDSCKGCQ